MKLSNTISDVVLAGFNYSANKTATLQAIQAAGGPEQTGVRQSFMVGYLAAELAPDDFAGGTIPLELEEQAVAILNKKGAGSRLQVTPGKARRSDKEESLYAAARQAWSRLLKAASVKSHEKRGTQSKVAKAETKPEPKKETAATPKASTSKDVATFLRQQSSMMMLYINKNADVASIEERNAVQTFAEMCKAFKD